MTFQEILAVVVTFLTISWTTIDGATEYSLCKDNKCTSTKEFQWTFTVDLEKPLQQTEKICITGDSNFLGGWIPEKSLILNKTDQATKWSGKVYFSGNCKLRYRFFTCVVDNVGDLQIRNWETHMDGRSVALNEKNTVTSDRYGFINGHKKVSRGWLNKGNILHFKLFKNPIQLKKPNPNQKIFIKVTAVDYDRNTIEKFERPITSSAKAKVEFVRMRYGKSIIKKQPEYGVLYEIDDIVIYHITTTQLKDIAYKFTMYGETDGSYRKLGYQYVYPETIDKTVGTTKVKLMSPNTFKLIGTIKIDWLLIKPLPKTFGKLNFENTFMHYWRPEWTALDYGHRGLGAISANPPPVTQNTIASMKETGRYKGDGVEFDLHLTSDLIPIIFHDYHISVSRTGEKPKSIKDLKEILIKDITYDELKTLTTYQIVDSKIIEFPSHNAEPVRDLRLFPTFEELLVNVNLTIGLDIEIKYPQQLLSGEFESNQTIDKNVYVNRILDVMLHKGCGRLSFFSSFDADICSILQFKQNMYPVALLGPSTAVSYMDPRLENLQQTINNAQAFDLLGVVPHSYNFLNNCVNQVSLATDLDLKLFIWGDDSNSTRMVNYFKSCNATGVIYGKIYLYIPKNKTNILTQRDLPAFFQKQCIL